MDVKVAIDRLRKAFANDPDYRHGWQANIAMAFQDEAHHQGSRDSRKKLHSIGNKAAKRFLDLLIRDAPAP